MADTLQSSPRSKTILLHILGIFLLCASLAAAGYFYVQYQNLNKKVVKSADTKKKESEQLVKSLQDVILLPKEEPVVATVTDKSKLAGQKFFAHAENGDKVLVFQKAKKAILYRPSEKKIIEVSNVTTNQETSQNAKVAGVQTETKPTPTISSEIKVVIYNGTETAGIADIAQKQIEDEHIKNVKVIDTQKAIKKDYTESLVIDLSGKNKAVAGQLAKIVEGTIQTDVPEGETKPEADILIIVGKK